jgi:hypothetical protein
MLNVLGKPLMIVNSAKVAHDLFERRGTTYSDRYVMILNLVNGLIFLLYRPRLPMIVELYVI